MQPHNRVQNQAALKKTTKLEVEILRQHKLIQTQVLDFTYQIGKIMAVSLTSEFTSN